jgi:hypothetical protein
MVVLLSRAEFNLFMNLKKAYAALRKILLCNVVIEFGISMKLVRLIKMYVNETFSDVHKAERLSDAFPI